MADADDPNYFCIRGYDTSNMDNSGQNGITITKAAVYVNDKIAAVKFERPLDLSASGLMNLEFEEYYYAWLSWGVQ